MSCDYVRRLRHCILVFITIPPYACPKVILFWDDVDDDSDAPLMLGIAALSMSCWKGIVSLLTIGLSCKINLPVGSAAILLSMDCRLTGPVSSPSFATASARVGSANAVVAE